MLSRVSLKMFGLLICLATSPAYGEENAISLLEIRPYDQFSGTISNSNVEISGTELTADVRYKIDNYFDVLGNELSTRGNFGSEERRLYFTGPTKGTAAGAEGFSFETTLRYEHWLVTDLVFDRVKTKLFQNTERVQLFIVPSFSAEQDDFGFEIRTASTPFIAINFDSRVTDIVSRLPFSPFEWRSTAEAGEPFLVSNAQLKYIDSEIFNLGSGLIIYLRISFDVDPSNEAVSNPTEQTIEKAFEAGVIELFQQR